MSESNRINKWSESEYLKWLSNQKIQRSYLGEVVSQIEELKPLMELSNYGNLNYQDKFYPLYILKSHNFSQEKPNILITGGVHGYETSGVHGALNFLMTKMKDYQDSFNFVCASCISPWGYETINRWNPNALDPNRNFFKGSSAQECVLIMSALEKLNLNFLAHFDLHETTDTDNTEFRPLLEKRDGIPQDLWEIPDGFYLVGDTSRTENSFQQAMIESVRKVTHIAPSDKEGKLIGVETESEGVINYDVKRLHLCAGMTDAKYVTTTEVYPDSPKVTPKQCNLAQAAAISGGLNYLKTKILGS